MKTLVVETEKIKHNLKIIKEIIEKNNQKTKIIAVIKGNGYGLGLIEYAQLLVDNGIEILAVATVEEAIKLRTSGIKQEILMMSSTAVKEDIEELATMFKDMLGTQSDNDETPYVKEMESHFIPAEDFSASYSFMIEGVKKPLYIRVDQDDLIIHYGNEEPIDVYVKLSQDVMESVIDGRMTFQRAFMTGEMTAKGNFKTLRMLDQLFPF